MKVALLLAGLLIAASATSATAGSNYIGASGGISIFHDSDVNEAGFPAATLSYDTGFGINVGGGHKFDNGLRLEGEFGYKKADVSNSSLGPTNDSDLSVMSFMFNGFYDFKTPTMVKPFVGAGIGALRGKISTPTRDFDDTVFGYQVSAGVSFELAKYWNIDVSYRFEGAGPDFNMEGADISYHSSNILAGFRYTFH